MRKRGLDPVADVRLDRLGRDVGKHGHTGAERTQIERLRLGALDGCIVSDATLQLLRAGDQAEGLAIAWTTPPFPHCNFTALDPSLAAHDRFVELLFGMHPLTRRSANPCDSNRPTGGSKPTSPATPISSTLSAPTQPKPARIEHPAPRRER